MTFLAILVSCVAIAPAYAQLEIEGADGSDLAFTATTTSNRINLAAAPTGVWNGPNTNPGRGVYDPEKWAVVFRYSSVNIPAGRTLSFSNHVSRAPVVWLVSGDVTINGTLDISSREREIVDDLHEPGPGGFRGGSDAAIGAGTGHGPGRGREFLSSNYGNASLGGASTYGNARIVPLLGGSGSKGYPIQPWYSGAGGGAILIVAKSNITVNGQVLAQGRGAASAGAIRLVGNRVIGTGELHAEFPTFGRIRIESAQPASNGLRSYPSTIAVSPDSPVLVWPPASQPSVRLVSLNGIPFGSDPLANLGLNGGDLRITNSGISTVIVETRNMPLSSRVKLLVSPKYLETAEITAGYFATRVAGGTTNLATWQLRTNLPAGLFTLQVHATTQ